MPILAFLILAVAAIAALGAGHARGAAPVAGEIVICTGAGVVTVGVDADGNPVVGHAPCPECTLTALPAAAASATPARPLRATALGFPGSCQGAARAPAASHPPIRAPPMAV